MIIGMHQANLLPYVGVTDRIRSCDLFIALTHVQFTRGNYHNRFKHNERWYTLSTSQKLEPLTNKRYNQPQEDWAKIKRKLPSFDRVLSHFDDLLGESLVETNIAILKRTCERLGITTPIVTDYPTSLTSTDRLVDLCKHYGATGYYSGPSGAKYINEDAFHAAGIDVTYQMPSKDKQAAIELLAMQGGW